MFGGLQLQHVRVTSRLGWRGGGAIERVPVGCSELRPDLKRPDLWGIKDHKREPAL